MDPVEVEGAFGGSHGQWDGLAAGDHVPRPAFTDALVLSVDAVCRAHTRVVA